jgi:hypothetical protein
MRASNSNPAPPVNATGAFWVAISFPSLRIPSIRFLASPRWAIWHPNAFRWATWVPLYDLPRRLGCCGRRAASNCPRPFPRYCHAPRLKPSHCVALRRVPKDATRCAAPSKVTETAGVYVVLRGLGVGAPSKNRTCDLGFRKALLYPTELRGRAGFVRRRLSRSRLVLKCFWARAQQGPECGE